MAKNGTTKPAPKNAPKSKSRTPLLDAAMVQNPHRPPVNNGWNKAAAALLSEEAGGLVTEKMSAVELLDIFKRYSPYAGWKGPVKAAYRKLYPSAPVDGDVDA